MPIKVSIPPLTEVSHFPAHTRSVIGALFHRETDAIITHAADGVFRVWTRSTGRQRSCIDPRPGVISDWRLTADGQTNVASTLDGSFRFWDVQTGKQLRSLQRPRLGESMAISPDARTLITTDGSDVLYLDAVTGAQRSRIETNQRWVNSVSVSADGARVLTAGSDGSVRLWTFTGQPLTKFKAHFGPVTSAAFIAEDRIQSKGEDGETCLWDNQGRLIRRFDGHAIKSVTFSPDGMRLLCVDERGTIQLQNVANGTRISSGPTSNEQITKLWFVNEDTGCVLRVDGSVVCWDLRAGEILSDRSLAPHHRGLAAISTSPDGNWAISAGAQVVLWNINDRAMPRLLRGHNGPTLATAFAGNDTAVTAGWDGTVRGWDIQRARQQWSVDVSKIEVSALAISADGNFMATSDGGVTSREGQIRLWTLRDRADSRVLARAPAGATTMAFSPDGRRLAWGTSDGAVYVTDVFPNAAPSTLLSAHRGPVHSVCWTNQGNLWTTGEDGNLRLWDVAQARQTREAISLGASGLAIAISPDGERLLLGCRDNSLRLISSVDRRPLAQNMIFESGVWGVAFLPQNRILAGSFVGEIRVMEYLP